MAGNQYITGLASGLKTDDIIEKMVEISRRPLDKLEAQQKKANEQTAAWQTLTARLLALKLKAWNLSSPTSFLTRTASLSASDQSLLDVRADASAQAGSYNLRVDRVAQSHAMRSQGFSSLTDSLATGAIRVGAGSTTTTITVDSSNNTLTGLRDAINRANVGVTAGIANLGSGDTHDYRLVLTSTATGEANSIIWEPDLAEGQQLVFTTTREAQDALITVGSGASAVQVQRASNTISGVFTGVTLDLKAADAGRDITFSIGLDSSDVTTRVKEMVDQFNQLVDYINELDRYDVSTGVTSLLYSDTNLRQMRDELLATVYRDMSTGAPGMGSVTQAGISLDQTGRMTLNEELLEQALRTDPQGVSRLFTSSGQSTDQSISYLSSTSNTQPSTGAGYTVRIDQTALQARVTAGVAQSGSLVADETLTINNVSISLTSGMTATQVLDAINAKSGQTGVLAERTGADGTGTGAYLTLKSTTWGASSRVTVVSTASNSGDTTTGFGTVTVTESSAAGEAGTGTGNAGRDVRGAYGVFIGNAVVWENATGMGNVLVGNAGNAYTDGLRIASTSTTTGEHGQVSLHRGLAGMLDAMANRYTASTGLITLAEQALEEQMTSLKNDIIDQTERLQRFEANTRYKFNRLEAIMAKLQSQSSYLEAQVKALSSRSDK